MTGTGTGPKKTDRTGPAGLAVRPVYGLPAGLPVNRRPAGLPVATGQPVTGRSTGKPAGLKIFRIIILSLDSDN